MIELPGFEVRSTALVAVDLQADFLPGGALGVPDGNAVLEPIAALLRSDRFAVCVATQDWHPPGHVSFASSHAGHRPLEVIDLYGHEQVLWPDHCVQGSAGARLHDSLPWERVGVIIRKGADPRTDSYSTFRNNWDRSGRRPPTGLAGCLEERGIETVVLCGLARDYCVKWSAEDAVAAGFRTIVLWELTRPVDPRSDGLVRAALERVGVEIR
jgi:nicotinamidase/pyrazinamidase